MSSHLDEITIQMPKGTRALLKEIKEKTGLTAEDVLKLGFRYLEKKQEFEMRKAQELSTQQDTQETTKTPSNIITPDRF
jgi:hypothetical protein